MTPPPGGPTLVVLAAGRARRYGGVKPLAPVGLSGEAVVDLLVSDAVAAGWGRFVVVVGHETGPAIRYHIERNWPAWVDVHLCRQELPRGTVDAVLAAAGALVPGEPFGVANADDLYGVDGLALLARTLPLAGAGATHTLVAYRLRDTIVGDEPVTRGVCQVGRDGLLRKVAPVGADRYQAHDDREPAELDPDGPVSVNLWGFSPSALDAFEHAMLDAGNGDVSAEVLLPEVVGDLVAGRRSGLDATTTVRVVTATGRCIGVTHPGDLALVRAELAGQVGSGERAATLWTERPQPAPTQEPATAGT
jgi:hypothetical protein